MLCRFEYIFNMAVVRNGDINYVDIGIRITHGNRHGYLLAPGSVAEIYGGSGTGRTYSHLQGFKRSFLGTGIVVASVRRNIKGLARCRNRIRSGLRLLALSAVSSLIFSASLLVVSSLLVTSSLLIALLLLFVV